MVSSGIEKTLPYMLSSDFVFKSKDDGFVKKLDKKKELMVVQYKDGTHDVIDLSTKPAKNGNGGFYISNSKITELKEGDKFKKNEIIARNPSFFHGNRNSTSYVTGTLAKIAIAPGDFTLEDSSIVTSKLSEDMACYITMMKDVNLGVNSNVEFIIKKGDKVKTGDPLIIFENSFDSAEANKLLDRLGSEFNQAISEMGKNTIRSKYTGEVVDIKIYYNRELDEMSKTLKKIIENYNSEIDEKRSFIKKNIGKNEKATSINLPPSDKINEKKISGTDIDGVYIEFYIRYKDDLYIGDKITFSVGLKTIISDVFDPGEEPFSEFRQDEEVSAIVSPFGVINRMTTDVFFQMYINKVLIELKRKVKDIYLGK
jgi:hypothetical protein